MPSPSSKVSSQFFSFPLSLSLSFHNYLSFSASPKHPFFSKRNSTHPCLAHTIPWRMRVGWIRCLLLQIQSLSFPTVLCAWGANLALWLMVGVGSAKYLQKVGGLEKREVVGLSSPFPKASASVWWPYPQSQFFLQVLIIFTSSCPFRPGSGNSSPVLLALGRLRTPCWFPYTLPTPL